MSGFHTGEKQCWHGNREALSKTTARAVNRTAVCGTTSESRRSSLRRATHTHTHSSYIPHACCVLYIYKKHHMTLTYTNMHAYTRPRQAAWRTDWERFINQRVSKPTQLLSQSVYALFSFSSLGFETAIQTFTAPQRAKDKTTIIFTNAKHKTQDRAPSLERTNGFNL